MDALEYNKSRNYSISTVQVVQRVVGATPDGKWGPQTVKDVRTWQGHHGLRVDGKVGPDTLHAILATVSHPQGGDASDRAQAHDDGGMGDQAGPRVADTIRTVGVWAGLSSLGHNAGPDVAFCQAHNINRLDVFVNAVPQAQTFSMHDEGELVDLCTRARDAGMEIHLTSWIMPFDTYIDGAAAALIPLAEQVGAKSLIWDAEEPWNKHPSANYEAAAERIAKAFESLPCAMNISGIINTRSERFGPLARVCEVMVPQCYATSRNGLDPRTVVNLGVDRWRKAFAEDKPFIAGLAAYRQSEVDGLGTRAAMVAALDDAKRLGIDTVCYWSLAAIKSSPVVASVVSEILDPSCPPPATEG